MQKIQQKLYITFLLLLTINIKSSTHSQIDSIYYQIIHCIIIQHMNQQRPRPLFTIEDFHLHQGEPPHPNQPNPLHLGDIERPIDHDNLNHENYFDLFTLNPAYPNMLRPHLRKIYELAVYVRYYEHFPKQIIQRNRQILFNTFDGRDFSGYNLSLRKQKYISLLQRYRRFLQRSLKTCSSAINHGQYDFYDMHFIELKKVKGFCFTTTNEMNNVLHFYHRLSCWSIDPAKDGNYFFFKDTSDPAKEIRSFYSKLQRSIDSIQQYNVEQAGYFLQKQIDIFQLKFADYIKKRTKKIARMIHQIQQVDFSIEPDVFQYIMRWITQWNLKQFELKFFIPRTPINPEKIIHIHFPNLKFLDLVDNRIDNTQFMKFLSAPNLSEINLKGNQITCLKSFVSCKTILKTFQFLDNPLNYHEMKKLERMQIGKIDGGNQELKLQTSFETIPSELLSQFLPRLPILSQNKILTEGRSAEKRASLDLRVINKWKNYSQEKLNWIIIDN